MTTSAHPRLSFPLSTLAPLAGSERDAALGYLEQAQRAAAAATCVRSKCGAAVVRDGVVLGLGWNSPPETCVPQSCRKDDGSLGVGFKSDRTCCTHAEVRAITNSLRAGRNVDNATLYFARVDTDGNRTASGAPYCTICSKFAVETGVSFFVLEHAFGVVAYPTDLYNELSFSYGRTDDVSLRILARPRQRSGLQSG